MKPFLSPTRVVALILLLPLMLSAQDSDDWVSTEFDSLIQVSRQHTASAEFDAAFEASRQAKALALECCGETSAAYASFCFNEGRVHDFMSSDEEAIVWYTRSLNLREELLGKTHIDYSKSLNNLASVFVELGQLDKAEPLYLESLEIREQTVGVESSDYAKVLYNLSGLYHEIGDFERAELRGIEAKEIRERVLGKDHEHYASSLINLANISYETNNFERALALYLEAKAILEKQEYLPFYSYVATLDNLGAIHEQLGKFVEAETFYDRAAELRLQVFGEDTENYALTLNHLASVYKYTDRLAEAEQALQQALAILERLGMNSTTTYAYSLQDLSDVNQSLGRLEDAQELQEQAIGILGQHLQKYHPRYLRSLRSMAQLKQERGQNEDAATLLRELAQVEEKTLANAVRHMTEAELANFTRDFERNLFQYFALAEADPSIADVCYDKILLYKGFLQTKALELRQLAQSDEAIQTYFQALRQLHIELGQLYTAADQSEEAIAALEAEAYQLEKELVRQNAAFDDALEQVRWQAVQTALATDEAAVEFVDYRTAAGIRRYGALLLLPNADAPLFISLCDVEAVEEQVRNNSGASIPFINALYSSSQLYQLLWEPLALALETAAINTVHYSATGLIHRINLAALPTSAGTILSEDYQLMAIGSTRQLAAGESPSTLPPATRQAVLYGGIDYGTADGPINDAAAVASAYPAQRGYDGQQDAWQALSWTEIEVVSADDLLASEGYSTVLKTGSDASEAAFKKLGKAPIHILHVATHGYFFPDEGEQGPEDVELAFQQSEHAMIRSGLILADGNYAWKNGQPRQAGAEDGILTAYEVSKMDLHQTELVILSACETGLGDIKGREGVYGLQRAFKIAGARYIIMTLWQVPDFETQAFMTTFYLAWLEEGKTIPEAFRNAQDYMRARYKDAHKWAGFILIE